jgi:hypothetical protein
MYLIDSIKISSLALSYKHIDKMGSFFKLKGQFFVAGLMLNFTFPYKGNWSLHWPQVFR